MSVSLNNSSTQPLSSNSIYIGRWDDILQYQNIQINLNADSNCVITMYYSNDKNLVYSQSFNYSSNNNFNEIVNSTNRYVYFTVRNNTANNQTKFNFSVLYKSNPQYDLTDLSGLSVDISGQVVDISGQVVDISGQVVDISGQVVDISGQVVDISGQVVKSHIYDSSGNTISSVSNSLKTYVSNLADISGTTVLIGTNPVIVKEKPTGSISLDGLSTTSQVVKTSSGCLNGFYVSNVGGSSAGFVKLYNATSAVAGDVSLLTITIHKDSQIFINSGNMNFSSGLCCRAVDSFADSSNVSASGSVGITAFFSGYSV